MGSSSSAPPPLAGHAAFARADVPDARRGRPAADLDAYAARRALRPLGQHVPGGWEAALPDDARLRFNVLAGTVADRPACVMHWLRPWPVHNGTPRHAAFHGVRYRSSNRPWWKALLDLSWLPVIGWIFDVFGDTGADDTPDAIGVPCTLVVMPVPGVAGLPDLTIDNLAKPRWVDCHRERLDARGLPGWTLMSRGEPAPAAVDRLLSARVREVLGRAEGAPFFELRLRDGALRVCRDGFLADDADLDALLEVAAVIGDALGRADRPAASTM